MSVGLGLLFKIISDGLSVGVLEEKGITKDALIQQEVKVYDFIRKYFVKFGKLPSLKTIEVETRVRFPSFPDEPLEYWIQRVEERHHSALMSSYSQKIQALLANGEVEEARVLVRNLYSQIGSFDDTIQIRQMQAIAEEVLEKHDQLQLSSKMSGVPFGIPYLDEISGGAQGGDTIIIVGTKSVGKTWCILSMCLSCFASGGTPLLVTLEMTPVQVVRRMMALRTNVTNTMIRLGRLSHWAREKLGNDVSWLKEQNRPFPIFQGSLRSTVEDLFVKVQELRPTAVYVDGAYLLRVRSKNLGRVERVAESAEWLKTIAKDFNIPVFGTYQFNRKGRGLENLGWSDSMGQLGGIVIGIREENEEEEATRDNPQRFSSSQEFKVFELLKGREGERGRIRMLFDMSRMRIEQDEVIEGCSIFSGEEESNG